MTTQVDVLLFDDACPMCTFQMRCLTWLDWRNVVRLVPLSSPESAELAPQLTPDDLREAIHCVTPDARVFRGAYAFRHLGFRIPALIPLGMILWVPGMMWIAERVYMAVSRNRYLMSRWFGCETACAYVPARNPETAVIKDDDS